MHVLPLWCAKQRKYKQTASPAVVSIYVLFRITWLSDALWTALLERRLRWHLVVRHKPNDLSSQWRDIESRTSEHWLARLSQHPQLWKTSSLSGMNQNGAFLRSALWEIRLQISQWSSCIDGFTGSSGAIVIVVGQHFQLSQRGQSRCALFTP